MELEYCPNCIFELITVKHKVGLRVNWMKCPVCGFINTPVKHKIDIKKQGAFIDKIRRSNKNLNQFNIDTEY